jgi:hypothetical protein
LFPSPRDFNYPALAFVSSGCTSIGRTLWVFWSLCDALRPTSSGVFEVSADGKLVAELLDEADVFFVFDLGEGGERKRARE